MCLGAVKNRVRLIAGDDSCASGPVVSLLRCPVSTKKRARRLSRAKVYSTRVEPAARVLRDARAEAEKEEIVNRPQGQKAQCVMSTPRYPGKIAQFVPWIMSRATVWKTTPAAVGLTASQATALDNAAKALQTAFDEANTLRQKSKNATETQNDALRAALTLLQQDIRIIDAFAANSASPAAVYTAAEIDPPAVPQPVPAPGAVTDITVGIDIVCGAPILKWKGNNPGGSSNVSYIVKRRLQSEAFFAFVGVAGSSGPDARTFSDNTLPQGADSVSYTITAQRGSVAGPSTQVSVRFGVVGTPPAVQSVKLAA